ncbi:MAG TPA: glycosyltransferase family 2 protein [Miltoncostaeaceae bacterium]|nr:glycosyltransferase family 2 protein [Miltoncostaeaceae bacterium]
MTRPSGGDAAEPLVSVLIPVYNGERFLEEAIASVRAQTYGNWRLVITDNASSDATPDIARAHAREDDRIVLRTHVEFLPVYGNFNRAYGSAEPGSSYVKFLCADDVLYPECLRLMVGVGERHPTVGLVSAHRHNGDQLDIGGVPIGEERIDGALAARRLLMGGTYGFLFGSPTSILLRAGLPHRSGPFDEGLLHADTDLGYAVLAESDLGFVHQVLTYTRRHSAAITSYASRMSTYRPEYIRILRRWGPLFLSPADYERRLAVLTVLYGRDLLGRPRRLADQDFRAYHREAARVALEGEAMRVGRGLARQAGRSTRRVAAKVAGRP